MMTHERAWPRGAFQITGCFQWDQWPIGVGGAWRSNRGVQRGLDRTPPKPCTGQEASNGQGNATVGCRDCRTDIDLCFMDGGDRACTRNGESRIDTCRKRPDTQGRCRAPLCTNARANSEAVIGFNLVVRTGHLTRNMVTTKPG